MKRMIGIAMLAVAGLAAFSSCTKDPMNNLTEEESRIYITNRNQNADFGSYKTYSIPDSVYVIDNNNFTGGQTTTWDVQALAAVRNALESRGYVRVPRSQSPDLGINVSRLYNTSTNIVNLQDYWGGYGGYWDPYYWGYPGYDYYFPPVYGTYTVTEGGAAVDMFDLKNAASNNQLRQVWSGLVRGSGTFTVARATKHAQALFQQSPYIAK